MKKRESDQLPNSMSVPMARRSNLRRAKAPSGIRDGLIREDLSLRGALRLLLEGPRLVPFGPGFDVGLRRVGDLDLSPIFRATAATNEQEWRQEGQGQQMSAFFESGIGQFGSPDETWKERRRRRWAGWKSQSSMIPILIYTKFMPRAVANNFVTEKSDAKTLTDFDSLIEPAHHCQTLRCLGIAQGLTIPGRMAAQLLYPLGRR